MPTPAFSVILVRPQNTSNLGSIARVAKNFGLNRLSIVDPGVWPDLDSQRLATGADELLAAIDRYPGLDDAMAEFPVVVATTSLRGRGITRTLVLSELPDFLSESGGAPAAFVFGPERSGLKEEELTRSSACLRLPTDPAFPTMNLSHAVALVLGVATAFARAVDPAPPPEAWAPAAEIEAAIAHWDRALEAIDFYDTGHRERSLRDWRRLVTGRPMTVREVAILRGVANRVLVALRRSRRAR